jgi:hypothetical protein
MQRRDFLLLRVASDREIELSCEQLYMRFADARVDGTVSRLFETLATDLAGAGRIRLVDRSWLAAADFKSEVDAALDRFRRSGGEVRLT